MEVVPVSEVLSQHPKQLVEPVLTALQANDTLYTALCLQPRGRIRITESGIGHAESVAAAANVKDLFRLAGEAKPDLLVCPEYSVPWEVLLQLIEAGAGPERGKLWVLGCESLPLGMLDTYRNRIADQAVVIDEGVGGGPITTQQYRNPVAYLFRTTSNVDSSEHLVVLVQYKTDASGDPGNTEARGMLPGRAVYVFGKGEGEVRLMTLICSDVFGLQEKDILPYYDRLLLIHVQLNNNPRHALYKPYRTKLFGYGGRTELFCLNWAADVVVVDGNGALVAEWHNIGGSAWYTRSAQIDLSDAKLVENHQRGLYYTHARALRAHAFHLHYSPRAFLLEATKVFHHGVIAPKTHLTGPHALATYQWDSAAGHWVLGDKAELRPADGFSQMLARVSDGTCDMTDLENVYATSPVDVERTLAISAGEFGPRSEWFEATNIDSMQLCEQEVVRRMTVTLDPEGADFRSRRMSSARALCDLRAAGFHWPSEVGFLNDGFALTWSKAIPNRNIRAQDGRHATVVFAGQVGDRQLLEKIDQRARHTLTGHLPEPEQVLTEEEERARRMKHFSQVQRLCVLYGTTAGAVVYANPRSTAIATPANASVVDIATPAQRKQSDEEAKP